MTKPAMRVTKCVFSQDADCCDPGSEDQVLTVFEENDSPNPSDCFYALESERWAFNSIEDVVAILRRAGVRETAGAEFQRDEVTGERVVSEGI